MDCSKQVVSTPPPCLTVSQCSHRPDDGTSVTFVIGNPANRECLRTKASLSARQVQNVLSAAMTL